MGDQGALEHLVIFWDIVLETLIPSSHSNHDNVSSKFTVASVAADEVQRPLDQDDRDSHIMILNLSSHLILHGFV